MGVPHVRGLMRCGVPSRQGANEVWGPLTSGDVGVPSSQGANVKSGESITLQVEKCAFPSSLMSGGQVVPQSLP